MAPGIRWASRATMALALWVLVGPVEGTGREARLRRPGAPRSQPAVIRQQGEVVKKVDVFGLCNRGGLVFTGTVVEAHTIASTMSEPPTHSMQVWFEKVEILKGRKPADLTFRYSVREGEDPVPRPGRQFLAVANEPGAEPAVTVITALVEASEANLALARKAVALPVGWSLDEKGRPLSPWAALGRRAWPQDLSDTRLQSQMTCSKTGRPALMAGAGIALTVEQVPPRVLQKYQNPFGDGQFKVTVTNTSDKAADVPALLSDGRKILWSKSLVVIDRDTPRLLPSAGALVGEVRPARLEGGKGVSTVIDTLVLEGVRWPRGGSRVRFLFCLGELSADNFFYYSSRHHDGLRREALNRLKDRENPESRIQESE